MVVTELVTYIMKYWLVFVVLHTVADFILQTREDATNKHKCNKALASHCTTYALALTSFSIIILTETLDMAGLMTWVPVIFLYVFIGHFLTDYVTSRFSHKYSQAQQWKQFWIVIGIDQLIHLVHVTLLFIGLVAIGEKYDNSRNYKRSTNNTIEMQIPRTNRI